MMLSPFQCLLHCEFLSQRSTRFLLAASGPRLLSFDIATGELKSTWSTRRETLNQEEDERPMKRLRSLESQQSSRSSSAEIVIQESSRPKVKRKEQILDKPNIVKLAKTADSKYVVAVTGEDKSIRVFKISEEGILSHFSAR